ncbi:hypothetical protein CSHISOI_02330, partial [Colletotrichum shisoi]
MQPKPTMAAAPHIRPAIRHRGLLFATAAVAALAVSFRYTAASRRTNEQNQRSSNPHYVSVDRSGGGI